MITREELSSSLREYLAGLRLTDAQVNEIIKRFTGDKTLLKTVDKSTLVNAINENKIRLDEVDSEMELKANKNEIETELMKKANRDEVVRKGYGSLNDFNEETRQAILENNNIAINYVLGIKNVINENLADNSVDYSKIEFVELDKPVNRFNKSKITKGYQVVSTTGELREHEQSCVTDYIPVFPGDVIKSTGTWEGAFYDSSKHYVSGRGFEQVEIIVPKNARYYRESVNLNLVNTAMITVNNELPSSYVPYHEDIIDFRDDFKNEIKKVVKTVKIGANNTDFFEINKTVNLFNKQTLINNKAIDKANGELYEHETGGASDFIEVEPNTQYTTKGNWEGAFYNYNKLYISGKSFGVTTFTTPPDACFFRYSIPMVNKDSEMMVKGSVLPSDYIPFGNDLLFTNDSYVNSIYKQLHPLYGKKWVVVGDSLTEKNIRTTKNYHDYIAEETGINVYNMGVGGTGYKRSESKLDGYRAFYQRIVDVPVDADIVTIFGSGNDLTLISQLGTPTDTIKHGTICGCMNETFKRLFERIPGVKVGVVLPCPWGNYPPSVSDNAMARYSEALREVAKRYSIPVLDLYYGSNLRPWDESFKKLYYKRDDGNYVHPDEDGHKILANKFKMFIQSL